MFAAPTFQQHIGLTGLNSFPPVDLIGFGNAQLQTYPRYVAAPAPFGQGLAPASLLDQLAAERDQTAAALARAMSELPRAPPKP